MIRSTIAVLLAALVAAFSYPAVAAPAKRPVVWNGGPEDATAPWRIHFTILADGAVSVERRWLVQSYPTLDECMTARNAKVEALATEDFRLPDGTEVGAMWCQADGQAA